MRNYTVFRLLLLSSSLQLNLSSASDIPDRGQQTQDTQDNILERIEKLQTLTAHYTKDLTNKTPLVKSRSDLLRLYIETLNSYKSILGHYDMLESKAQGMALEKLINYRVDILIKLYQIMQTVVISTKCSAEFQSEYETLFKRLPPDTQEQLKGTDSTLRLMVQFDKVKHGTSNQNKRRKLETITQKFTEELSNKPFLDVAALHANLVLISTIHKETSWRKTVISILEKIEAAIRQLSPNPEHTPLPEIYMAYKKIIKNIDFKPTIIKILSAYVGEGRIQEALERAEILASEEKKTNNGIVSTDVRLLIANLKNILGDHTELLAIQATLAPTTKQHTLSRAVAEIKRQQQTQTDRDNAERLRTAEQQKLEHLKQELRTKKLQEQEAPSPVYQDSTPPRKNKRKAPLATQTSEPLASSSNAPSPELTIPSEHRYTQIKEAQNDKRTLTDLYDFTHTNKYVDEQIETNTWKFSRSELSQYFQSMGCEIKSGKGNHKKVSFPTSLQVIKDGKLITILSDIGGALILPQWDTIVPFYLRTQILDARNLIKWMTIQPHYSTEQ